MKRSRSTRHLHNPVQRDRVEKATAAEENGADAPPREGPPSLTSSSGADATEAFHEHSHGPSAQGRLAHSSRGHDATCLSVSASSISALDTEMRSRTASALLFPRGTGTAQATQLPGNVLGASGDGGRRGSGRGSTAIVRSVHASRDGAHDNEEEETLDDPPGSSGPLPIDKSELDVLGSKRRRPPGNVGVPFSPRQRRRLAKEAASGDTGEEDSGSGANEGHEPSPPESRQPTPTPRPKRPTTILTATPAFIRDARHHHNQHHHPLQPTAATPGKSSLARGMSNLRESFSLLMGTPAPKRALPPRVPLLSADTESPRPPQQLAQPSMAAPSPWALSSIKPQSPRPSVGSMGATVRRGGSDFAINLWPEEASLEPPAPSHGSTSNSSVTSSVARPSGPLGQGPDDRLHFLRRHSHRGRGQPTALDEDKENVVPVDARGGGAAAAAAAPPNVRRAAPSGISENLLDIISSSSGSRVRSSQRAHATPAPAAAGAPLNAERFRATRGREEAPREPSLASTVMEPDVSPIHKLSKEERRRPSAAVTAPAPHPASQPWQPPRANRGDTRPLHAQVTRPGPLPARGTAYMRTHYDYVAAVTEEEMLRDETSTERFTSRRPTGEAVHAVPSTIGVPSHGGSRVGLRHPHRRDLASLLRNVCASCLAVLLTLCLLTFSLPLLSSTALPLLPWSHRGSPEEALAVLYVNPIAELHALYQIPAGSLRRQSDVHRLYLRILGEGVERLERAAAPLSPLDDPDTTHDQRMLFLRQMLYALEGVRRRSLQYARSRDASRWRRQVAYPLGDVWRYAILRQREDPWDTERTEEGVEGAGGGGRWSGADAARRRGRKPTNAPRRPRGAGFFTSVLLRPSLSGLVDRVVTAVACLELGGADLSLLPLCPSLRLREEAMVSAAQAYLYLDVNAQYDMTEKQWRAQVLAARLQRDWDSEVYVETLLQFLRRDTLKGVRSYSAW